jgi:ABC-type uncharacterized transport system permease subunit
MSLMTRVQALPDACVTKFCSHWSSMEKRNMQKLWQALACLACVIVLWIHLDDFGASEFSGGRITGKLFTMADLASLLFIVAVLVTILFPRIAAVIALTASLLCLPFYLYVLLPGPYRQIFKGEYSVPLHRSVVWNTWAVLGVLSLLAAGALSVRGLFMFRSRSLKTR